MRGKRNRRIPWLGVLLVTIFAAITAPAVPQREVRVEEVLERLVTAGEALETLEARLVKTRKVSFTGSTSTENGKIYFTTEDSGRIRISMSDPAPQEVVVSGGEARSYAPRVNQLTVFDLGERQNAAQYFMLGFGPANAALAQDYEVTLVGEEVLGDIPTSVLELKPRSDRVAGMFPTIRLWIDQERWIPVQSRLNEASGDYQVVGYSDIRINVPIPDSTFDLDVPRDAQIIRM